MQSVEPRYTVITPSRGDKPKALHNALQSVLMAKEQAGLGSGDVEMLVGFDGCKGLRVLDHPAVRYFDFPRDGDFGNAIRNGLLKAARGRRLLFLDDDNALTPHAFVCYEGCAGAEMVLARIDTSRTLNVPWLPVEEKGKDLVRPTNVDSLCACVSRELALVRCKGWESQGGYVADFHNLHRYWRRANSVWLCREIVGIYDAGLGLDQVALSAVQRRRLQVKQEKPQG